MEPVRVQSLADVVTRKIREAIVSGEISPGTKLSEVTLAKELGVSRGPVREALSRLEGSNLLERRTNLGVTVAEHDPEDLYELLLVREGLEGMAARLAAENVTEGDITELRALLDLHAKQINAEEARGYYQDGADYDFHFRVIKLSGNRRLIKMLCVDLYDLLRVYRYKASVKQGRAEQALQEHVSILDAIAARDPDAAEAAMRTHMRHSRSQLVNQGSQTAKN